jgi:Ca2+-binding EF-hand superfamily protein
MLDEIAVLSKFEKFGFDRHSLITREQLAALLRRLTRENKGPKAEEWPTELIDELCRECKLNSKGQLEIHQYVQVIVRAQH